MGELSQGSQDVIYENGVPDGPGIVERCRKSVFVPVELAQTLIDEEGNLPRKDRILNADVTLVCG